MRKCGILGLVIGLLCLAGCGPANPRVKVPQVLSEIASQPFQTDVTKGELGDLPSTWPTFKLQLSWQSKAKGGVVKYKLHKSIPALLKDQLAANGMPLAEEGETVLQVRVMQVGIPKTGASTGGMKVLKVRLAAWLVQDGGDKICYGVFDGVKILSSMAKPNRDAYEAAAKDAVSRLVRKLMAGKRKVES